MMQRAKIGILALAFCLAGTSAQALNLGTAGDYNVFVFGDFSGSNSDVQGRLAAGGSVTLENYGMGDQLPANSGDVLVAGGDLTLTNVGIHNGNAVVGDDAVPVDFTAARDYLTGLSDELSKLSVTGTTDTIWGGLFFQGDDSSALQVFNINGNALSTASDFRFRDNTPMTPADATLVFNISGESVGMGNFDMFSFMNLLGEDWDNVLFNFYEAETLNLGSIGIYGSILAPWADITTGWGQINGTVVANSWNGPMQVNNRPFDGDIPAPVPEPATLLLFGSGLLGLVGATRRKRG